MNWIKEVLVDIIVSVFIIVAVFLEISWMRWVITGYTAILLLAKVIVLAGDNALQLIRKTKTSAPDWFSHLLYALNTVILLYAQWWYIAGGWLLIWLLSFIAQRKLKVKTGG